MFLNSDNKKVVSYLESKELSQYKKIFLELLADDKKIDKKDLKILIKNIRHDLEEKVKEILSDIFLKNKIDFTAISKKSVNDKSVNDRVKKFREKNKERGFKNLSFYISPIDYEILQKIKIKKNMTYSELISFLLNSENNI